MPRLRRFLTIASAALALLLAAAWITCQFRYAFVSHASARVSRNDSIPVGAMGAWEFRRVMWSLAITPRGPILGRSEFLSLNDTSPDFSRFDRLLGTEANMYASGPIRFDWSYWYFHDASGIGALGFAHRLSTASGAATRTVAVPFWFLIVAFSVGPLLAFRRARRTRLRLSRGQCTRCGYQLDASITTCPECGGIRPASPQSRQ